MSPEEMCQSNYNLFKKYYGGPNVVIDKETNYTWMKYSHYHSPYYFYKYAVGMTAALVIGGNIVSGNQEFKEKYIKFLSNGASKDTLDLYKELGIDLEDKTTFEHALKYFNEKVQLLKELINN